MVRSEIEYANVSINWTFNQILPQLPAPGTDAFAFLIRELRPFNISPRQITFESPTHTLGDIALNFLLLEGRLNSRLTYGALDINAQDVNSEDVINILKIINIIFEALKMIDIAVMSGSANTRLGFHISLQEKTVDDYFAERVSTTLSSERITPEAIAFLLQTDDLTKTIQTRLTVAKSLAYENALFVEINYQAESSVESFYSQNPPAFFDHLSTNYQSIISILELETNNGESE